MKIKIEIDIGKYVAAGQNEKYIIPTIAYISTYYNNITPVNYRGIVFKWWNFFLNIRAVDRD